VILETDIYVFTQCDLLWQCASQTEVIMWFVKIKMWMEFIFSCKDRFVFSGYFCVI